MSTATAKTASEPTIGELETYVSNVLNFLGSLKWTVGLFAVSIVIVMVGTMAQDEMNMQQVKDAYFTTWFSSIYLDDFVPQSLYFHETRIGATEANPAGYSFPFLGGKLIGFALLINLIAAKITRFHIRASGGRLTAGIAFCLVGLGILGYVVQSGSATEGLQGQPPSYPMVWYGLQAFIVAGLVGSIYGLTQAERSGWKWVFRTMIAGFGVALGAIALGFTIGEPGLRIVWQLAKGLGIAAILQVGCSLLFEKQGGNLLLHFGVALLMVGQFAFGDKQLEQRLILNEREASNTLVNMDKVEMAFIDKSDEEAERIIAIPSSMLARFEGKEDRITSPELPFEIEVVDYMLNSGIADKKTENPSDTGLGTEFVVREKPPVGGADSEINIASAYVKIYEKDKSEPLGTYLVSQYLNDGEKIFNSSSITDTFDTLKAENKSFDIGMRYRRVPKPYWVQLTEVRRINYSGTETPRDYSSFIKIVEPDTGEQRKERIWMNNPLRYRGETFYQSQYLEMPGGQKATVLQVVRNQGWLIPYIACGIVALGMGVHFLGTLDRFIKRRERETAKQETAALEMGPWTMLSFAAPVVLFVYMLVPWSPVSMAIKPEKRVSEFDMFAAGKIPVMHGGRVMPLDQFARQTLKTISNKDSLSTKIAPKALTDRVGKRLSAMEWFFEIVSGQEEILDMPMFRIDAVEVLSEVGLSVRKEKIYSYNELEGAFEDIESIVQIAREKDERSRTFKEAATLQLYSRLNQFMMVRETFRDPARPEDIPREMIPEGMTTEDVQLALLRNDSERVASLQQMGGPMVFPPKDADAEVQGVNPEWQRYASAALNVYSAGLDGKEESVPGFDAFVAMKTSYRDADPATFNQSADTAIAEIRAASPAELVPWRVALERWVVDRNPKIAAMVVYIAALLMGLTCLMVKLPRVQRATLIFLGIAFALHTAMIICRMMITNRAPVINLYSSAVFIAWAGVLAGIVMEIIYRHSIGNVVAAMSGMLGLLVAHGLDSGDTMPVLQAVLDTQFWLGTHVITITLGYSATFLAGLLGMVYLLSSSKISPSLSEKRRDLYRMIYGACCFGILFSFVGTVLGGLWADDSWGRFWGWDPKENGALLIVIWNALMLHARWDGMVGERGFATLSIGGNIVTAWSWFGTNQLGFGLHSYGGQDSVKMLLLYFLISQIVLIGIGIAGSYMGGSNPPGGGGPKPATR